MSRGIYSSCRFYLMMVLSPTWWIPPLRFAAVGMTMRLRFYGFAYCSYNISRRPAALIRLAQASQLPPREALVPCFWVVSFNRTGYNCNAAGGRLPPLQPLRPTGHRLAGMAPVKIYKNGPVFLEQVTRLTIAKPALGRYYGNRFQRKGREDHGTGQSPHCGYCGAPGA